MNYHNRLLIAPLLAAGLLAFPSLARAQSGVIAGVVRDTAARPISGADIILRPGDRRTRSDSAGHFLIAGLGADHYIVRARKLGYAPTEGDVSLSNAGRADVQLVFDQRLPMLDTITVIAGRACSEYSLDGFVCRRRAGVGTFLDYTEIDDKDALYTADIFREMKGFHVEPHATRYGPVRRVVPSQPWGCITSLVDGRAATGATIIPELPEHLIALEVYAKPETVPAEYQRYTWADDNSTRARRCSVIIYWTTRARMTPRP